MREPRTYLASLGKEQNSKSEVQFLLNAHQLHTIAELKICKWKHPKSVYLPEVGRTGVKALVLEILQLRPERAQ